MLPISASQHLSLGAVHEILYLTTLYHVPCQIRFVHMMYIDMVILESAKCMAQIKCYRLVTID